MSIDNVVFSSTFSSDGGVYVCGDRGGNLHFANVSAGQSNFKIMSTECGTIYSLAFLAGSSTVACGGDAMFGVFDITAGTGPVMRLQVPSSNFRLGRSESCAEINSVAFDKERSILFGGSGDGRVYGFDVRTGQCVTTLECGSPVYAITLADAASSTPSSAIPLGNVTTPLVFAGGEDGIVNIFDIRQTRISGAPLHQLAPFTTGGLVASHTAVHSTVHQAHHHISCLSIQWPWLVLGGSNRYLSMFHLSNFDLAAAMPMASEPTSVAFAANRILSVAHDGCLYSFGMTGALMSCTPALHAKPLWTISVNPLSYRDADSTQQSIFGEPRHSFRQAEPMATSVLGQGNVLVAGCSGMKHCEVEIFGNELILPPVAISI